MAEGEGISVFQPPRPAANPAPATPQPRTSPVSDARVADGTRSNPPMSEAQRRYKADYDRLTSESDWRRQDVVITKDADGTLRTRPRTGNGQPTAVPGTGAQPQPQTGPAKVEGDRLKFGDFELSEADVRGLMERKGVEDSRRATMPKDAGDYSLDLPEDFQLPPGASAWHWNLEDPASAALLGQAKNFAFEHGLDKPAFAKLLGLYASHQIAEEGRYAELRKAELAKLGANISTRVDAVGTWLESQLGSDLAKALRTTMFTAKSVEAYERLMRKHISQGVTGNPSAGRDPGRDKPGRLSDAEYSKLTYTQKIQYAQQFDQREFNGS
jgi:hypothetical protein